MISDFPDLIHPSYSLLHHATIKCYAGMYTSFSLSKLLAWILTAGHTAEESLQPSRQIPFLWVYISVSFILKYHYSSRLTPFEMLPLPNCWSYPYLKHFLFVGRIYSIPCWLVRRILPNSSQIWSQNTGSNSPLMNNIFILNSRQEPKCLPHRNILAAEITWGFTSGSGHLVAPIVFLVHQALLHGPASNHSIYKTICLSLWIYLSHPKWNLCTSPRCICPRPICKRHSQRANIREGCKVFICSVLHTVLTWS